MFISTLIEEISTSPDLKEITEEIIQGVKELDPEHLIFNPKGILIDTHEQDFLEDENISLIFDKGLYTLKFWITKNKDGEIFIWDMILSWTYPNHGPKITFRLDNIELHREERTIYFSKGEVDKSKLRSAIQKSMWIGYSVWGNRWGYITKEGRKCRHRLSSMKIGKFVKDGQSLKFLPGKNYFSYT